MLALVLLFSCNSRQQRPLPTLSYSGTTPRVQDPLSPEDSRRHIQLPRGFEAELFAAEPNIINPIAFTWDERGRLWVVQAMDYPHELVKEVGGDRITICSDSDHDGKADQFVDYAINQNLTTGIVVVRGGVIVAQAPEMVFLQDTDGDDKMDKRTVLFDGFGIWDTHAGPSNLKYGMDNMLWGSVGYAGFENSFDGQTVNFTRGVYRFSKDGQIFEPVGQFNNNTWGLGLTEDFEVFGSTANNNHCCYVGIPLRHYSYLDKRPSWAINADFIQGHYEISPVDTVPLQQVDVRGGYTAAAGANFYTADNYPAEYRNHMYVNEPTGHLVHIARIVDEGAGYVEEDGGNIFASTDAWTAPVHAETGPDGNLWVADWYNPVIQHNPDKRGMDNQIWNADRGEGNAHINPLRDKRHGRIYVIKYGRSKKSSIESLDPQDDKGLLAALNSSNMFWRQTAQRLIVEHEKQELIPDLVKLGAKHSIGAAHALWSLHGLGALDGVNSEANQVAEEGLGSKIVAVQKAALSLLPATEKGSDLLVNSGLLESSNLHVRLAAILRASELPETNRLYQTMEHISKMKPNDSDKWLKAGLKIYFKTQNFEAIEEDKVTMVILSSAERKVTWRYTETKPDNNWNKLGFDDSTWKEGSGILGTPGKSPAVGTSWTSADVWLRRKVTLDDGLQNPVLKVLHDEDYQIFVNGELFFADKGVSRKYRLIRLETKESELFKTGENVVAVHCHNANGNQFIDVGIGEEVDVGAEHVLQLNTVSQKMAYDQTVLHAMAGQDIEIVLNNVDEMPHNLVLIQAGSLETFGKLVDDFLKSPDAEEMEYVPKSRYVLGATQMLDPGERGNIRLKLPDKPDDYPFICTFPGHWRMMQGVLKVSPRGSYISDDPMALQIVGMGGGGSHDFTRFFGVADGRILSQEGENTYHYTEDPQELGRLLSSTNVLFLTNNKPINVETREIIMDRVNQGMSMLIYHPSTWYNWSDWPEYNRVLVGGGSKSHEKLQEFEVKVIKRNHPIMEGVPHTFRITDELYRWEADNKGSNIEVLAIGKGLESGAEFPVVWVVKHGKAKIVCNTLGHDADAHNLPAYQTILGNSLNWVKPAIKPVVQ